MPRLSGRSFSLHRARQRLLLLALLVFTLTPALAMGSPESHTPTLVALTTGNALIEFSPATPGTVSTPVLITGLQVGESLVGIDFRPATGQLYGVGSTGRLYLIDQATGAATLVATLAPEPTDGTTPYTGLVGTSFGVDFNPVPDRLRVTSDAGQNLRINPVNGLVVTDATLFYAPGDTNQAATPNVVASAYTNSFAGAASTTLYNIDSDLDILTDQNPPNNGVLNTKGSLGTNTSDIAGFDIFGTAPLAYAALTAPAAVTSQLYTINLVSGAATLVGTIGGGLTVVDISAELTGVIRFAAANDTVREDAGVVNITVSRVGGSSGTVTVDYATVDGTATAPPDYTPTSGTLTFADGETSKTIALSVNNDALNEGNEALQIVLSNSNPSDSGVLGVPSTVTVTITDNDDPREIIYALNDSNGIFRLDADSPGFIDSTVFVSGLAGGESLLGFDYRPSNMQVYALSNLGRLYNLNLVTGAASFVAQLAADPTDVTNPYTGLNGTSFGVDFNPVVDLLRVTSNTGQNLRINPTNGLVTTDGSLAYAVGDPNQGDVPNVVASAYANNFVGAATTTLYNIEAGQNTLTIQNPPADGNLLTTGSLGITISALAGFDISGATGVAYASLTPTPGNIANLYTVNLGTGSVTLIGVIGPGTQIRDITVGPLEPTAVTIASAAADSMPMQRGVLLLTALTGLVLVGLRWRRSVRTTR